MAVKYLDDNGLLYYDSKVKARLANKQDRLNGVSGLANDAGYMTSAEVAAAIASSKLGTYQVVDTVPPTGEAGVVYLVGTEAPYEQWIWEDPNWISLGSTDSVEVNGYVKDSDLQPITNGEIDTITG
jgi:hypothetical protein